eukprot:COSAG02_NODE_16739_length_1059_cov_1.720833_1_plen_202_part_00
MSPLAARVALLCPVPGVVLFTVAGRVGTCDQVYFEVAKPEPDGPGIDYTQLDDSCRFIQYSFPAEVLSLSNIGTTYVAATLASQASDRQRLTRGAWHRYRLAFCVGNEPVSNFRMIERCVVRTISVDCAPRLRFRTCVCARRHYFRDRLLKSFDFTFPFWSVPTLRNCSAARCGSFRTVVPPVAVSRTARTRGRPSTRSQK